MTQNERMSGESLFLTRCFKMLPTSYFFPPSLTLPARLLLPFFGTVAILRWQRRAENKSGVVKLVSVGGYFDWAFMVSTAKSLRCSQTG